MSGARLLPLALAAAGAAIGTAACASPPLPRPEVPFTALDARRDGAALGIRYLGPEGLLYSSSTLPWRVDAAPPADGGAFPVYVVAPDATGREPPGGERAGHRVPVLGPDTYAAVLAAAVDDLVPPEPRRAVIVEMRGADAAVYRDDDGRLETWIDAPPDGVEVVARVPLEACLGGLPAAMDDVLRENGIAAREVLINTGEADRNPWPFVYVDLDAPAAAYVLVSGPVATSSGQPGGFLLLTGPAQQVIAAHTLGILQRPVTSTVRLLGMLADAARDTVTPNWTFRMHTDPVPPLNDGPGMDLAKWEAELDARLGRTPADGTMRCLVDGEAFFTRFEETVRAARESILVRMYIFDNDDFALRIADLLRERAADGVDVRVLVDGLGTAAAGVSPPAGLPEGYEPPASIVDYLQDDSDLRVRTVLDPFGASDHTKSVVVDENVAFVGGMNIGREYRYEWHDAMVELHGPVIARIADDFDAAWAGAGLFGDLGELVERILPGRTARSEGAYPVRVLYTGATASEIRNAQLDAIRRSRRYVYLHHAYLADDAILHALIAARHRGVDVRVVIPLVSDRGAIARNSVLAANALFRNGVRVHVFPGMSHMKAAVYDGWACLGSANANHLSLRFNRETNVATSDPEAVREIVERIFEADFRASPEMRNEFPTRWHDYLWEMIGDYLY